MPYIRLGLWIFWMILVTAVLMFGIFPAYPIARLLGVAENFSHRYNIFWSRVCIFWLPVQLHGEENLLTDQPVMLMSNHQGNMDIFAYNKALKMQFRWLSKTSIFRIPVTGWCMYMARYIPIERNSLKDSKRAMDEVYSRLTREKKTVLVFPEGTWCKPDGHLLSFKRGVFLTAVKAKIPIQVSVIYGSHLVMPGDSYTLRRKPIHIHILHPLFPEEYESWSEQQLMEWVREQMTQKLQAIRASYPNR
jgi:1-acyl-sn-glycerol-3-phosphate acyltransferase